jgi:hypothetical protein
MIPFALVIPFVKANPRLVAYVVGAVVMAVVAYKVYDAIGDARENQIVVKAVETEREVQVEKDRIRNNRPDRAAVIVSLRNGTF